MTDAVEIAKALDLDPPTPQQIAVIEADLTPSLVIAGAGSGKTETMANRVLWLLANEKVRASEILGLTFTRKAAGELLARIRKRVGQLPRRASSPTTTTRSRPPRSRPTTRSRTRSSATTPCWSGARPTAPCWATPAPGSSPAP